MTSQNKNSHTDKTKNRRYTFGQKSELNDFTRFKLLSRGYDVKM